MQYLTISMTRDLFFYIVVQMIYNVVDCGGRWNVLRGVCRVWIGDCEQDVWPGDVSRDLHYMGFNCYGDDLLGWAHFWSSF